MQEYNINYVKFLSGMINEEQFHEMEDMFKSSNGMAPIDPTVARRIARHYFDPVRNLENQAKSLQMTDGELQALDLIKRTSQKIGIDLESNVINITRAIDYMNLLSQLQKTDLKRIAGYIDNLRMGVHEDLMPYIKKVNPNPSFN